MSKIKKKEVYVLHNEYPGTLEANSIEAIFETWKGLWEYLRKAYKGDTEEEIIEMLEGSEGYYIMSYFIKP
tara:strand:- start:297 stop:509 length:213 start_codon:yes stop_codon:yes gene_type:complete